MKWWRRRKDFLDSFSGDERSRRLDDALSSWPRRADDAVAGPASDAMAGIDDELAAARALRRAADQAGPTPVEPLITLRAGLAARAAVEPGPAWRRVLTAQHAAPVLAAVGLVALILALPLWSAGHPATPRLAASQAQENLEQAKASVARVQQGIDREADPKALLDAIVAAQTAAARAEAAARLAGADDRTRLNELIQQQQRSIDQLRNRVDELTRPTLPPATSTAQPPPTTTTTVRPPATTTTTVPTTTTRPPTTTTTTPPSTTRPPTTTTTTPPSTTTTIGPQVAAGGSGR